MATNESAPETANNEAPDPQSATSGQETKPVSQEGESVNQDSISHSEQSEPVLVDTVGRVRARHRYLVDVHGREVVVFAIKDTFYALDKKCYHAGGPLDMGDIEELNERICVICPWHKYKICLDNGEGLYQSIDPYNKEKPPEWTSKGIKQRTHKVMVEDGKVYVTLSDLNDKRESDWCYAEEETNEISIKVPTVKK